MHKKELNRSPVKLHPAPHIDIDMVWTDGRKEPPDVFRDFVSDRGLFSLNQA